MTNAATAASPPSYMTDWFMWRVIQLRARIDALERILNKPVGPQSERYYTQRRTECFAILSALQIQEWNKPL